MRVLLTGATGFVGSHAASALQAAGHSLRLFVRTPSKLERALAHQGIQADDVAVGDMTDAATVAAALDGCDAVVHAAASVEIGRSARIFDSNLAGIRNVVGGAAQRGLDPVVHVSSVATLFPPPGPVITPDDPVANLETEYGRSKAEGERFVRELQQEGAPVVSVYPTGIYGPFDPGPTQTMRGLRDRLRFGWLLTTGGVGIVDVRDVARVLAACVEAKRGPRRFMAGGHFLPWREEADLCESIAGRRVRRFPGPRRLVLALGHAVDALQRLVPGFDYPLTHEAAQFATGFVPTDDRRTHEELGIHYRPVSETLRDAITWLVESGELDPSRAPALRRPGTASGGSP